MNVLVIGQSNAERWFGRYSLGAASFRSQLSDSLGEQVTLVNAGRRRDRSLAYPCG
jgi:hypothetical protein